MLAHEYPVSGAFQLSAGPETVRADPVFPRREFRIHVDMTPRSWDEVRAAIHEQDQILRCGLALDPDTLLPRLRERLHEGFDVKLPRSLFRPVDLPAACCTLHVLQRHESVKETSQSADFSCSRPLAGPRSLL